MNQLYEAMGAEAIATLWKECEKVFVEKDGNKVLSDNNFTDEERDKLEELTKDYRDLDNLPKINGVEVTGDLTIEDLKLDFEIQTALDGFTPKVKTGASSNYNEDVFADGTSAQWYAVNHMVTVQLTMIVLAEPTVPILGSTPVQVLNDQLPAPYDPEWKHLGRYMDAENVILEFWVNEDGILHTICLGQIPSDRLYTVTFTYIAK